MSTLIVETLMLFSRTTVKAKIFLTMMGMAALSTLILVVVFSRLNQNTLKKDLLREVGGLLELGKLESLKSIEANDPAAAERVLKNLTNSPLINGANISLADGRDFVSYPKGFVATDSQQNNEDTMVFGGKIISDQQVHLGDLLVRADLSAIKNAQIEFIFLGTIIGALMLLLSIGIALVLSRKICHPILSLNDSVKNIADTGSLKSNITINSKDEIGELAKSFNRMLDEIRKSRRAIEEKTIELERSNTDLEQFAYIASHDLQEPLRKISGFSQLFSQKYQGKIDEKADSYIRYMVDASTRMRQLIKDLLAFSRVGGHRGEFKAIDCNAIVKESIENLSRSIEESQAKIHFNSLPKILGDESQIMRLFQNLISNGIKFHAEKNPIISVMAREEDDCYQFAIKDNGIGIDPKFSEKVFKIFQRLHTKSQYEGTGVGLAICKKIVERHGGRLWLESEVGKGSTFYFTTPKINLSEGRYREGSQDAV